MLLQNHRQNLLCIKSIGHRCCNQRFERLTSYLLVLKVWQQQADHFTFGFLRPLRASVLAQEAPLAPLAEIFTILLEKWLQRRPWNLLPGASYEY